MKKRIIIVVAIILLFTSIFVINLSNQNAREIEKLYIYNSIYQPLSEMTSLMLYLENQFSEAIDLDEIDLSALYEMENTHEVIARFFYIVKDNYNNFVRNNSDYIINGRTYSNRMINIGNNLQRLKTLLESDSNKTRFKVEGEIFDLINGSRLFILGYNRDLTVLDKINFHKIEKRRDFYKNKHWHEFIYLLDKPIIIEE